MSAPVIEMKPSDFLMPSLGEDAVKHDESDLRGIRHILDEQGVTITITAKSYFDFFWQCLYMKNELIRCVSLFRTVGACGPIIIAASAAQVRLKELRSLFEWNTMSMLNQYPQNLFPDADRNRGRNVKMHDVYAVHMHLSDALKEMRVAFLEFSTLFHDEKLMSELEVLPNQLNGHAKWLIYNIRSTGELTAVDQAKLHTRLPSLLKDINALRQSLNEFLSEGVPVIKATQKAQTEHYQILMASATFLAGVTASMLQITNTNNGNPWQIATNALFLSSMTFSIGATVSSILSLSWRNSFIRSPDRHLPVAVRALLMKGPMVSLVSAGITFSLGLCCFVVNNNQAPFTTVVTVILASAYGIMLSFLASWFVYEKWTIHRRASRISILLNPDSISLLVFSRFCDCIIPTRRRPIDNAESNALPVYASMDTTLPTNNVDVQFAPFVRSLAGPSLSIEHPSSNPAAAAFGAPGTSSHWRATRSVDA